jgi:hypothetical protein
MTAAFSSETFSPVTFNTDAAQGHAFSRTTFSSVTFCTDDDDGTTLRGRLKRRWRGKLGYLGQPSPALKVIQELAEKAAEEQRQAEVAEKADRQRQKALKQALKEQGIAYEKQFAKLLAEYVVLAREVAREIEAERAQALQVIEQARLAAIALEEEEQQILLLLLEV